MEEGNHTIHQLRSEGSAEETAYCETVRDFKDWTKKPRPCSRSQAI